MSRILVTGDKGFVGQWLVKALKERGDTILGYDIVDDHDITDLKYLSEYVKEFKPDRIFHLAAIASVPKSFDDPLKTMRTNVEGSMNVLEAAGGIRTLIASTGHVNTDSSPYTVSKLATEKIAKFYPNVVITRAHNHAGPGQSDEYAVSSFAKQIALIEKRKQAEIRYGNLESTRNYTDVRDIVAAYIRLIDGEAGTYEVCSDNNYSMEHLLTQLKTLARCPIMTSPDESMMRETTHFEAWGSDNTIPLQQTLEDTLNYWRARV